MELWATEDCGYLIPLNHKYTLHQRNIVSSIYHSYETQDGIFDCCWSEQHENHIASSSGDGSISLWDVSMANHPIKHWKEHTREVYSVDWNLVRKDVFASASWDQQIKIWGPGDRESLQTLRGHGACVYSVSWSPHQANTLASAAGDTTCRIWDVRSSSATTTIRAHDGEVLTIDWNKYKPGIIATAGVDKSIRVWDLKFPSRPLLIMTGHEYAVRRIKWSPHSPDIIASASYDMTLRLWNTLKAPLHNTMVYDQHTEFVVGLDFSLFDPLKIASSSWDQQIHIFNI